MTNSMESAFDTFSMAAEAAKNSGTKNLQMEAFTLLHAWLTGIPGSLLPDVIERLKLAEKAKETTTDPLAGLVTFLTGHPSNVNGNAPLAALGSGAGTAPAAPAPLDSGDTLTPREMSLLEKYRTFTPAAQAWWEEIMRDFDNLNNDKKMGAANAFEAISQGKQEVDNLGRPLAEQDVNRLNRENSALESDKADLTAKVERLKKDKTDLTTQVSTLTGDLAAARTAKPTGTAPAAANDKLLMATLTTIGFVNGLYGLRAPTTLGATDEQAVIDYLMKGSFQTAVGNAAKAEGDRRNDAEAKVKTYVEAAKEARHLLRAAKAENTGTLLKPKLEIIGFMPVDQKLWNITGEMLDLKKKS